MMAFLQSLDYATQPQLPLFAARQPEEDEDLDEEELAIAWQIADREWGFIKLGVNR